MIIFHWVEAWAALIPLYVFIYRRPGEQFLEIIALFLLTTFCINTIEVISWRFHDCMPMYLKNNNFLYNINSFVRIIFFSLFFQKATKLFSKKSLIIFLSIYILIFVWYLYINSRFLLLNSMLHTCESFILLSLSIIYLFKLIKSEKSIYTFDSYLLIISGLAIYESVSFFIYLFYQYLPDKNDEFAHNIWYVIDIGFIIFCLFTARAFFGNNKIKHED